MEAAAALSCLSSYNEIVGKLNRMWEDQMTVIRNVDDVRNWFHSGTSATSPISTLMRLNKESVLVRCPYSRGYSTCMSSRRRKGGLVREVSSFSVRGCAKGGVPLYQ